MDLSDLSVATPKALNRCLALFEQSRAASTPASLPPATPAKYAANPHIQFFSTVKAKNHFAYHKSKRALGPATPARHRASARDVRPFSRRQLLGRLKSYTALNFALPYLGPAHHVSELFCASHGWEGVPVSRHSPALNQLRCTSCSSRVTLKFNQCEALLDESDIQHINANLAAAYKQQLATSAHAERCPWRDFSTPDSAYYLVPHLSLTNETLVAEYLALLIKLFRNIDKCEKYTDCLQSLAAAAAPGLPGDIAAVSNQWLLARYFKDTKENMASVLEAKLPHWAYILAATGWDTEVQTAAPAVLLSCSSCNQRALFWQDQESPSLSHKPWCLHLKNMDEKPFVDYFVDMLHSSASSIGPDGQFSASNDIDPEGAVTGNTKMDVEEGLERFAKLRKLYFAE